MIYTYIYYVLGVDDVRSEAQTPVVAVGHP